MESSRNAFENINPNHVEITVGAGGERGTTNASSEKTLRLVLVQLSHHSIRRGNWLVVVVVGEQGEVRLGQRQSGEGFGEPVVRLRGGACLSCCCCGYTSCTAKAKSWAGNRIFRVLWGSRWWCRRWSAGVESGRSWTSRLAAGCSCSVSGISRENKHH